MTVTVPAAIATIRLDGEPQLDMELLSVERGFGSGRQDTAVFRVNYNPLADVGILDLWVGKKCEVVLNRDGASERIHVGRVIEVDFGIDEKASFVRLTSRLEKYHLGRRLQGIHCLSRYALSEVRGAEVFEQPLYIDQPTVFNPHFQGRVTGNRHELKHNGNHYYFMDLQQSRTNRGVAWAVGDESVDYDDEWLPDVGGDLWTLGDAILYLCWTLNPEELWVANPVDDAETLNAQLIKPGSPLEGVEDAFAFFDEIQNFVTAREIPEGVYLGEALDILLDPYHMTWYINYGDDPNPEKPQIKFHRLGSGEERTLKFAKDGQADINTTNIRSFRLSADAGRNLANTVTVVGDYPQREITFELLRTWRQGTGDDVFDDPSLSRRDNAEFFTSAEIQRTWREFWMNEAGDGSPLRTTGISGVELGPLINFGGLPIPIDLPSLLPLAVFESPELTSIPEQGKDRIHDAAKETGFQYHAMPRRKPFAPMLSRSDDGTPLGDVDGCLVQYTTVPWYQWYQAVSESDWKNLATIANVALLKQMGGIRIEDVALPSEVLSNPNLRVRITGSIAGDVKVRQSATSLAGPIDDRVELIVNAPKYTVKSRHETSLYSPVYLSGISSDETNDRPKMAQLAAQLLNAYNQMDLIGNFVTIGMNYDFNLGEKITKIEGREIDLKVRKDPAAYPEITHIRYDYQQQATQLVVSTYREIPQIIR